MPELPEVETIKRELNKRAIGKKISRLWSDHPKMVTGMSTRQLEERIKGTKLIKVARRAKNLLIELSSGETLWIHLKMTGHLLLKARKPTKKEQEFFLDKQNSYIHLIFYFSDGSTLAFSDLRKFGRVRLIFEKSNKIMKNPQEYGLGILGDEPISQKISPEKLRQLLQNKKTPIKLALMDQKLIAGIGNIYASEILFAAKVSPLKKSNELTKKEREKISKSIVKILKKAIKLGGTSVSDFRDLSGKKGGFGKELQVYQGTGKKCSRCGNMIKRIKQGQRSTFYCPICQK